MKKTTFKAFFYAICIMNSALCFTSCSSDDAESAPVILDAPMTITAGVDELTTTRANTTTAITSGDFGLFLSTKGSVDGSTEGTSKETNYDKYNTKNLKFEYSNNGWDIASSGQWSNQPTKQLLWKSSSNIVEYIAYRPFDASMTLTENKNGINAAPSSYTFTVKNDQSSTENVTASDFLYAVDHNTTKQEGSTAIDITFTHMMAKLRVAMTKGTELGNENVSITSVKLKNAILNKTFDLTNIKSNVTTDNKSTGEITLCSLTDKISDIYSNTDQTTTTKPDFLYECIVAPDDFSIEVEIAVGEKTYKYTGTKNETFSSGYVYTLNLTVGRDKVVLNNEKITATKWSVKNENGDGTLETE